MTIIEFPKPAAPEPQLLRVDDLLCSEAVMRAWAKIPGFHRPAVIRAALRAAAAVAVRRGQL